jgi:CheY-like chemotaxis protein
VNTLAMLRRMPHLADVPALFVTAATSEEDIARYIEAGAIGVIPKPLLPLRLTGQLHSLWDQHKNSAH